MLKVLSISFATAMLCWGQGGGFQGQVDFSGNGEIITAPFVNRWQVMSNCGSRAAYDPTVANGAVIFDTKYNTLCTVQQTKPALPSIPLWDIHSVTGPNDAGRVNLTSGLRPATVGNNCSVGNPNQYGNFMVFLAQNSVDCTNSNAAFDPGAGFKYNVMGCKMTTTSTPCTPAQTSVLYDNTIANTLFGAQSNGTLDPTFYEGNPNKIIISVLEVCLGGGSSNCFWSLVILTLDWSGTAPVVVSGERYVPPSPGDWQTFLGSLFFSCERYMKATTALDNGLGGTTVYLQADYLDVGLLVNGVTDRTSCTTLGADKRLSGSYKVDLYPAEQPNGRGWTQLFPTSQQQCNYSQFQEFQCYSEFAMVLTPYNWMMNATNYPPNVYAFYPDLLTNQHMDWGVSRLDGKNYRNATNLNVPGSALQTQFCPGFFCGVAKAQWNPIDKAFVSRVINGNNSLLRLDKVIKWHLTMVP